MARRFALRKLRTRSRRARRESQVARAQAQPSVVDQLARESALRQVTDGVLELQEPYRSTIFSRFYEGLSPREIAERDGVPLGTVESRLRRGVAQLKSKLDRCFGDRSSWCAALLPLAGDLRFLREGLSAGSSAATTTGILIMGKQKLAGIAALIGLTALTFLETIGTGEVAPIGMEGVSNTSSTAGPRTTAAMRTVSSTTTSWHRAATPSRSSAPGSPPTS